MNRYWSGLFVASSLAATIGLGAENLQGQNPTNTPPPDAAAQPGAQRAPAPPSAQQRTPNTVTMTGCIQSAPTAAAGRTTTGAPTTASAGAAQRFVLNSARMTAGGDARGAVGTTGTGATSYQLEGEALTISPHLNQRVEITGVIQGSAAPSGAANSAPGSTAASPTLRVSSVKMLASTCTPEASTPGTTGETLPLQQPPRQPQPEQQPPQQQAPVPPPQP